MNNTSRLGWIFLILGLLMVLIVGLLQPVIGDASLYASISKRMFNSGEFLDLYLIDQPYIQKPHLVFWLASISYALFGVNTVAFKLPSVIIGLSGVYALYLFGRDAFSKKIGFWSAFFWLFSLAFLLHANDIHMDTMMSGFILWTVYFWYKYLSFDQIKWLYVGTLPLALAMMTKGPLGAFVPVTGFIVAILYHWGIKKLFRWQHFFAAGLAFLLLSPVLYGIFQQHGIDGLTFYFWENNAGRVEREGDHSKDYFFYIHTLAWFFLPWSLLTFYSLGRLIHAFVKKQTSLALVFSFGCFIVFFIIASLSDGTAPHYMYTLLPFSALITGNFFLDQKHNSLKNTLIWIPLVLLIIVNIGALIYFPPNNFFSITAITFFLISIVLFIQEKHIRKKLLLITASLITMLFSTLNFQVFRDFLMPYDAITEATKYVNEHLHENEQYYIFDINNHHPARADFYAKNNVKYISEVHDLPINESIYVLVPDKFLEEVIELRAPKDSKEFAYLLLTRPFRSISAKIKGEEEEMEYFYLLNYTQ